MPTISFIHLRFTHRIKLPIRLPNKPFQPSALSLKLVCLEAVRVVAEHVEIRPPEHRTNDLRISRGWFHETLHKESKL